MEDSLEDAIAIVGVGCRFPGAHGPLEYWDLLLKGESQQRVFPKEDVSTSKRWNFDHFFHPSAENPGTATHRTVTFIDDIDKFDYEFFRLSPKESSEMDPQHRILLETCYEALEDSGMSFDDLQRPNNNVGVYVGSYAGDWTSMASQDLSEMNNYSILGRPLFMISNRISHWFDFRGPSMTIDTACSSSLSAIHLAIQALQRKECRLAMCCGANILLHPNISVLLSRQDVFSKDGFLRAFDKDASGYVRGEGFGTVILKPLKDALKDGDRIYATIKGSIISSGGKTKILTAPSVNAEAQMMKKALDLSHIDKDNLYYLEAHGTGTLVGDTTELNAIVEAYEPVDRALKEASYSKLRIGSVKSLIGHLEPASGVASLIKMSLCLYYSRLTPNANFREPNQNIDFELNNLSVQTEVEPIPTGDKPVIVGINSFGIGGTLGHVILENTPQHSFENWRSNISKEPGFAKWNLLSSREKSDETKIFYFPFSAGSKIALKAMLHKWKNLILTNNSNHGFEDKSVINVENAQDLENEFLRIDASLVAHALAFKKNHLPYRTLLIANSAESFLKELDSGIDFAENPSRNVLQKGKKKNASIGFIFPGQGPQCVWMGTELYQTQPVFRQTVTKIDSILQQKLGYSLIEKMSLFKGSRTDTDCLMMHPAYCQTAIFMFQVGIVELLASHGISPSACIGHSAGEVASSWCAGLLNLEEAVNVVIARAATMGALNETGGMLVLQCSKSVAEEICEKVKNEKSGFLEIAAINSSTSTTLSGANEELVRARKVAESMGVTATQMKTTTPYHSSAVQPYEDIMVKQLSDLNHKDDGERTSTPLYSSILGRKFDVENDKCDLGYWWKNTRDSVLFHDACLALYAEANDEIDYFIEIANHKSIGNIVLDVYKEVFPSGTVPKVLNCVMRDKPEVETYKNFLKHSYELGSEINWHNLLPLPSSTTNQCLSNIRLPMYSWNHDTSLWSETKVSENFRAGKVMNSSSLSNIGKSLAIDLNTDTFLADHVINDKCIFPAAGYLITALRTYFANKFQPQSQKFICLNDVLFQFPLILNKEKPSELSLQWPPSNNDKYTFSDHQRVFSEGSASVLDMDDFKALLRERYEEEVVPMEWPSTGESNFLCMTQVYDILKKFGLQYGPKFQNITKLVSGSGRALAELQGASDHQLFDIALLDACFQVTSFVTCDSSITYIPHGVKHFIYLNELKLNHPVEVEVRARGKNEVEKMSFDILVWQDKEIILALFDFFVAPLAQETQQTNFNHQTIYQSFAQRDINFDFLAQNPIDQSIFPADDASLTRATLAQLKKYFEQNHAAKEAADTPVSRFTAALASNEDAKLDDNFEDVKEVENPTGYLSKLTTLFSDTQKVFDSKQLTKEAFSSAVVTNSCQKLLTLIKELAKQLSVVRVYMVIPTDDALILQSFANSLEACTGSEWNHLELVVSYFDVDGVPKATHEILDTFQSKNITSRCEAQSTSSPKAYDQNDFHIAFSIGLNRSVGNVESVLNYVSQLLCPGGFFLSTEYTKVGLLGLVDIASGADWWRSNARPVLSNEEWNTALAKNGLDQVNNQANQIYSNNSYYNLSFVVARLNASHHETKCQYTIFGNDSAAAESLSKLLPESKIVSTKESSFTTEITNAKVQKDHVIVFVHRCSDASTEESIDQLSSVMETLRDLTASSDARAVLILLGENPTAFGVVGLCRAFNYENMIKFSLFWLKDFNGDFKIASDALSNKSFLTQSELLLTDGTWKVPKIVKAVSTTNESPLVNQEYNLEVPILNITRPPMISESFFGEYPFLPQNPAHDYVRIRVKAIGLNFKHVMILLGMLPGYVLENAGGECTGVIESVGDEELAKQRGLVVGTEVVAFLDGAGLGTLTDANINFCYPLPKSLTLESAATVPLVFCTAYLGLVKMANITKDDTVLIHSAAGGVGLAAVQIANMAGATVIASCSSAPKRKSLSEEFGVKHFVNSRSLEFEQEVMKITNGKGVSIVLNSLSGEYMDASIRCVEFGGRFIEIGKKDSLAGGKISLRMLMESNIQLLNCHLDMLLKHPNKMSDLFVEVLNLFKEEKLKALPYSSYDLLESCQEQMKVMAQGNHIGKIVLVVDKNQNDAQKVAQLKKPTQLRRLRPDATYLITGGVGSIGLALADQMVKCGAKRIVLCGRRGPSTYWQKASIFKLKKAGIDIIFETVDVSNEDQIRAVVAKYKDSLRGISHVAGILDDGSLPSMTKAKFKSVFVPKVFGAMNLHNATVDLGCQIDFFLMTSSIVAAMGNVAQVNYVTANYYLTGIMHMRRKMGLNASVIELGAVKGEFGSGMIQDALLKDTLTSRGLLFLSTAQASLGHVDMMLPFNWNSHVIFASLKWSLTGSFPNVTRRYTHMVATSWKLTTSSTSDFASKKNLARKKIRQEVSNILSLNIKDIDSDMPLANFGLDSLGSVQIIRFLKDEMGIIATQFDILGDASIDSLLERLPEGGLENANEEDELEEEEVEDKVVEVKPEETKIENSTKETKPAVDNKVRIENKQEIAIKKEEDFSLAVPAEHYNFANFTEYISRNQEIQDIKSRGLAHLPYFIQHDDYIGGTTRIQGVEYIDFTSYNYLSLVNDPEVIEFTQAAVKLYGTSVSASRFASGQRPIHQQLEDELASFLGTEASLVFSAGFMAISSVISTIAKNKKDLIFYDSLIHRSALDGINLSEAYQKFFPHNNHKYISDFLAKNRNKYERVLVVIEGVYSMDGDMPDLPKFVEIRNKYKIILMVDEAHSIGVLGKTGRGIGEHFGVGPTEVDVWAGTLSKSLASCGGYCSGSKVLIDFLKMQVASFVFSAGISPANTAASICALRKIAKEPYRIQKLHENSKLFLQVAKENGFDTYTSKDTAIVPIHIGDMSKALLICGQLFEHHINVIPIGYPAVAKGQERIRFFITSGHTEEQIRRTIQVLAEIMKNI